MNQLVADEGNIPQTGIMEKVLIGGDLSVLDERERVDYYAAVCKSVGLNPLTQPFEYLNLQGKLTLYAKRSCTDQLRAIHSISVEITHRDKQDDLYVVTARGTNPAGRSDESVGAVPLGNLTGDALANAIMKAETKAKRRVTLSICGLSILDETEVADLGAERPHQPAIEAPQRKSETKNKSTKKKTSAKKTPDNPDDLINGEQLKWLDETLQRAGVTEVQVLEHLEKNDVDEITAGELSGIRDWLKEVSTEEA